MFVLGIVIVQLESRRDAACVKGIARLVARTSELNSGGCGFKFRSDRWLGGCFLVVASTTHRTRS